MNEVRSGGMRLENPRIMRKFERNPKIGVLKTGGN